MKISGCTIFHCPDSIISGDIIELKLLFCDLPLASKKMMRIGEYMLIITVLLQVLLLDSAFCQLIYLLISFASTEEFVNGYVIGLAAFLGRQSISQLTWLLWLAGRGFKPWPD